MAQDERKLYRQAMDDISKIVAEGGFRRGDQLPSYRALARRLGVSLVTVQTAMGKLERSGLVRPIPGKGTVLAKRVPTRKRDLRQVGLAVFCRREVLFASPYRTEILQGAATEVQERGADLHLLAVHHSGQAQLLVVGPGSLYDKDVDGLLLLDVADHRYLGQCAGEPLPTVVLDGVADEPLDYVACDNAAAAGDVMAHLLALGHRRIAYLDPGQPGGSAPTDSDALERRQAYRQAMKTRDLDRYVRVITADSMNARNEAEAAARCLRSEAKPPTALLAYDANVANQAITVLTRSSVRVPQDVSVAAVVGGPEGATIDPVLTFARVDFVQMGRLAVQALASRCRQRRPTRPNILRVLGKLVIGNSVAPPASSSNRQ